MNELRKLLESQPINEAQKSELYIMVTFAKLTGDYAAVLRKGPNIKREAKQLFTDTVNFTENIIGRLRAGISTEAGKKGFTEAWEHDYHVWGNIVRYMSCMSPEQLDAVETFCEQMLNGGINYEASEQLKEQEQ